MRKSVETYVFCNDAERRVLGMDLVLLLPKIQGYRYIALSAAFLVLKECSRRQVRYL